MNSNQPDQADQANQPDQPTTTTETTEVTVTSETSPPTEALALDPAPERARLTPAVAPTPQEPTMSIPTNPQPSPSEVTSRAAMGPQTALRSVPDTPAVITGPSWELIIVGLIGLAAVAVGITQRVLDLTLDWSRVTTISLIGVGLMLAIVGLVGVLRRSPQA